MDQGSSRVILAEAAARIEVATIATIAVDQDEKTFGAVAVAVAGIILVINAAGNTI